MPPTQQVARRGIHEPPAIYRQPLRIWGAGDFQGDQWRFLVAQAPIVRSCVTTIVMYLNSREWFLEGDDQDAVAYYTQLLETADEGKGWITYSQRLIDDCLTMPFGGAAEIGPLPDGTISWTAHLDAATMRPTGLVDYPYGQIDPWGSREPIPFKESQVGRVPWMMETRLKVYEWTRPPAGDAIPAITALVRADRFWQSLLLDTPPAGILDLMDMTEQEASDWYESWKKLLSGQDGFKIPVLYGGAERKQPAVFIPFTKSPVEIDMMDVLKNYAEQVCACFGLSLADLGLFGQEMRLAGATKIMELSKRQGPANVARALKSMIDLDILPDGVTFTWREVDTEDSLRKAQGRLQSATAIASLKQAGVIPDRLASLSAEVLGIVPQEAIDQYNAEVEGQGEAVQVAPEDSTPTGDETKRAKRTSKWSKKMAVTADKLLAPSKRGFTKARIKELIGVGLAAYGEKRGNASVTPEIVSRSRESAEKALARKLASGSWWKSPNLAGEVFEILTGAYEDGIKESIKAAGGVVPRTVNLTNKDVLEALQSHAGEFITQIDDGTKDMIVKHVMAGVEHGISSPNIAESILADDVRATLLERWKGRTEAIVGTEIGTAESQAARKQYQELGLEKKRWKSISAIACEICLSNDELGPVEMDYGYETAFGTEADGPLAHPHCRCYLTFDKAELKALGNDVTFWLGE